MYYLPIFLLMIAGAWHAWRQSPEYSAKATLQYAAAVAVMIAAVIGAVAVIFKSTQDSPALGAILTIATVMVAVLGLTFAILRMASGTTTPLPASVPIGRFHRRRIARIGEHMGMALIYLALIALIVPQSWRLGVWIVAGFGSFICVLIWAPLYYQAGLFDRKLAALETNPWTHWQYTPEQWKNWTEVQVSRLQVSSHFVVKKQWRGLAIVVAILSGIILIRGGSLRDDVEVLSISLFALALTLILIILSGRGAPERLRRLYAQARPEAFFGRDGFFCAGEYKPWINAGNYLTGVFVDERAPRSLVFEFNQTSDWSTFTVAEPVLIPSHAETDVRMLQQNLGSLCPNAVLRIAQDGQSQQAETAVVLG